MERTGILKAIESRVRGNYMASEPEEGEKCPVCHGNGWEYISRNPNTVKACSYCNGGHARKVANALLRADIPTGRSLSDFDWTLYNSNVEREKQIVDNFVRRFPEFEQKGLGLYITSKTRGSGKTFLASAIGRELISRFAASVRFVSASDLINISKEKQDDGRDPLHDLIHCRVLILDDLSQQRTGHDWQTDILYRIIDERYRAKKVVIVTNNIALPELDFDDRIVDRLNAMTVTVKLPEVCIRAREAITRKEAILKDLGII